MGDNEQVPWVTRVGMDRSGRAILAWVAARLAARLDTFSDPLNVFPDLDALTAERTPRFPTVGDEYVGDQHWNEAPQVTEAPEPGSGLTFVLVGLAGLVGLCAIYPMVASWLWVVVSGGNAANAWPITVGVAATLSLAVALLADRVIPGRVALLLIGLMPLAVIAVVSATPPSNPSSSYPIPVASDPAAALITSPPAPSTSPVAAVVDITRFASASHYEVDVPSGWTTHPAEGSRHYDEFRSPDGLSAIRVQTFDTPVVQTLRDMIADDRTGILAQKGASIDGEEDETLPSGNPAHRIRFSIDTGSVRNYGVDLLTISGGRGILVTLLSIRPITPPLQTAFDQATDTLVVVP